MFAIVNMMAVAEAVPESDVDAEQLRPESRVWLIVSVPAIELPDVNEIVPAAPLLDDHAPDTADPFSDRFAATSSVTVAPAVTNCHVPVQLPATDTPGPLGEVGELLPQATASAAERAIVATRHRWRAVIG
jgi:hypothetical protein